VEKDYFHLRGQDNVYRYLPISPLMVRLHPDDSLFDILARVAAARVAGCDLNSSARRHCAARSPMKQTLIASHGRGRPHSLCRPGTRASADVLARRRR
jgi:hypothetical protein